MDPKHRHELEGSDLYSFVTNFRQWWDKHGTRTLLVVLLVLVAILGYQWIAGRAQHAKEVGEANLSAASPPEAPWQITPAKAAAAAGQFRSLAEGSSDPQYQVRAYLRGADVLSDAARNAAMVSSLGAATQPANVTAELRQALSEAGVMYQKVLDTAAAHPVYKLNAHVGLATVAESQGDLAAAREQYSAVVKEAGDKYPAQTARAKSGLDGLLRLARSVVFAPEPATQPSTRPGAATQPGLDFLQGAGFPFPVPPP